jgi:hypothetical protein
MGQGIDSSYVADVTTAPRKHLLVKKSNAETCFYYMGQFEVIEVDPARKKDNNGKERDIAKFQMKMHHAVREDLLRYLQSRIKKEEVKAGDLNLFDKYDILIKPRKQKGFMISM